MRCRFVALALAACCGFAVSPALAQPGPQMTEDDCRRKFLEAKPQDWEAYDECRRGAVQIKPEEPKGFEPYARTPDADRSIENLETSRPDHRI